MQKKQLFISDLHLQPERPDIFEALLWFLDNVAQDATELYLLGDIFEYWIGDDAPLPGAERLISALQTLQQHQDLAIFFQHGNRDFLVQMQWLEQANITLLPESYPLQLVNGQTAVLMHGDQLCTEDTEYQNFRSMVRDPAWQHQFLNKPLQERIAIAKSLRAESQARGAEKSYSIMDVSPDAVRETLLCAKVDHLIHGHTHRPAHHQNQVKQGQGERWVLGDWDQAGWYLEVDERKLQLIRFEFPASI